VHSINQQALAAAERIFEVLDARGDIVEDAPPVVLAPLKDRIVFDRVWFSYDGARHVLRDVSLEVPKGHAVALVGRSGAGKTTLVNLIPRFYDPSDGQVLLDGVPLTRASIVSLRRQIGIVSQEAFLFHDTVRANIKYGSPLASDEDVVEAAVRANAHDFIRRLPQGYDTLIGERGYRLSGGERQRISIARALLKDPPILILDEATSQLDSESERLIQQAIERLLKGRTVFMIAHRLSTIRHASKIVVMDEGRVVEEGRHEELLKSRGLYNQLYELQFSERPLQEIA
jgi:subfamily B ATP-binding cassette protein MsbA